MSAGLKDNACHFYLYQDIAGIVPVPRYVDDQPGRHCAIMLWLSGIINEFQEGLDLLSKSEKAVFKRQNRCFRDGQLLNDLSVGLFRVVPDHNTFIVHLFGNQT